MAKKAPNRAITISKFKALKIGSTHTIRFMRGMAEIISEPFSEEVKVEGVKQKQHAIKVIMRGGPWDGKQLTLIRQQFRNPTSVEYSDYNK